MSETRLMESTLQFLEEPLLGEQDLDTKVRLLLEAEYLRRLGRYRRLDRTLTQKYEMTFEAFIEGRVVQQKGYTWDVEKDAMDWETAVDGMRTMERKLQELRKLVDSHLTSGVVVRHQNRHTPTETINSVSTGRRVWARLAMSISSRTVVISSSTVSGVKEASLLSGQTQA